MQSTDHDINSIAISSDIRIIGNFEESFVNVNMLMLWIALHIIEPCTGSLVIQFSVIHWSYEVYRQFIFIIASTGLQFSCKACHEMLGGGRGAIVLKCIPGPGVKLQKNTYTLIL